MLLLSLLFMIFASAFGTISIRLTTVHGSNLPTNTEIQFSKYKSLGEGTTGTTKLVNFEGKDLVLKLVSEDMLAEIRNEFEILQVLNGKADALKPAAIIEAYGYGAYSIPTNLGLSTTKGCVLVLQYVCSPNLKALGFNFNATTQEILSAGLDLINLLEVTHNAGILHMDLKPSNLLYALKNINLAIVVVDWGSAKYINLHTRGLCGTITFWSPNVAAEGVHGPDDDLRSVMYTLAEAGFKGNLPWGVTSLFTAMKFIASALFGKSISEKKQAFEDKLEQQSLHPQLRNALVALRAHLGSGASRVPGHISYDSIRRVFKKAIIEVATTREERWTSSFINLFTIPVSWDEKE